MAAAAGHAQHQPERGFNLDVDRILRLPSDFRDLRDVSVTELVGRSGYLESPDELTADVIRQYLDQNDALAGEWLRWSDDKRTSSGWYVRESDDGLYEVGYFPDGPVMTYPDCASAVSQFILREVASIGSSSSAAGLLAHQRSACDAPTCQAQRTVAEGLGWTGERGIRVRELRGDMEELRRLLGEGAVQRAYSAIVAYMSGLRTDLASAHEGWSIAGLYQGYFDMTYFPVVTPSLKARGLKLAIVFDYSEFRFQVWLAARNRGIQRRYWELLRNNGWPPESLVEPAVGVDAIVIVDVADGVDLDVPDALTASIERSAKALLGELERFLDLHDPIAV